LLILLNLYFKYREIIAFLTTPSQ